MPTPLTKAEASPGKAEVAITSNPRAHLPENAPHSKKGAPPTGADVVVFADPKRNERVDAAPTSASPSAALAPGASVLGAPAKVAAPKRKRKAAAA